MKVWNAGEYPTAADLNDNFASVLFGKLINIINWCWSAFSSMGITCGNGSGAGSTMYGFYLAMISGTGAGGYVGSTGPCYNYFETGKLFTADFEFLGVDNITDGDLYLEFSTSTISTQPPTNTANHVGFKISSGTIYATVGNGSAETIQSTGITLSAGDQRHRLRVVLNVGTDCKFYVDDVLNNTITTNIPTTSSPNLILDAVPISSHSRTFKIGRILITKEY